NLVALHPAAAEAIGDLAIVARRHQVFDQLRDLGLVEFRAFDWEVNGPARNRRELLLDHASRTKSRSLLRNECLEAGHVLDAVGDDAEANRGRDAGFAKRLGEKHEAVETSRLVAAESRRIRHRIG